MAAFQSEPDWSLMQPFVKTLLLAAGLALAANAPSLSAADADADLGTPPAAQQTGSDSAAETSEATEAPAESSPARGSVEK